MAPLASLEMKLPEEEEVASIRQGYVDKPKGIEQVLFERGWLDPDEISQYTLAGKVVDGVVDEKTSLRRVLANCPDFRHEVSAMAELMKGIGH